VAYHKKVTEKWKNSLRIGSCTLLRHIYKYKQATYIKGSGVTFLMYEIKYLSPVNYDPVIADFKFMPKNVPMGGGLADQGQM